MLASLGAQPALHGLEVRNPNPNPNPNPNQHYDLHGVEVRNPNPNPNPNPNQHYTGSRWVTLTLTLT